MVGRSSHGQSGVGDGDNSVSGVDGGPASDVDSWLEEWTELFSEDEPATPVWAKTDDLGEADQHLDEITSISPSDSVPPPPNNVAAREVAKSGGVVAEPPTTPGFDAATLARPQTPKRIDGRSVAAARKGRFMPKPEGAAARVTGEIASHDGGADRRLIMAISVVGVVVVAGVIGYLLTGIGDNSRSDVSAPAGTAGDAATVEVLARSTVQLVGLDDNDKPNCAGSGVIVGSDGTILTNAHVVTTNPSCDFSSIGVAVIENTSSPAELLYRSEVIAVDRTLDLAVLRISSYLDSSLRGLPTSFPTAPLGDSGTVEIGDAIRILGFPVIGGETITFTTGSVAGFTSQVNVGSRALIKTDATISAGNSGGMAVNSRGEVIGVPTKAMASEGGPAVDCRPLEDTNGDGAVDAADVCVPVGGFLNGVRPINLALPLLQDAADSDVLGAVLEPEVDGPAIDLSQVSFNNPRFSIGRVDDEPAETVSTIVAGADELCFFVDWANVPAGVTWDGVWFVDGEIDLEVSFIGQVWTLAETGENFWICFPGRDAGGLVADTYEIGIFLDDTLMFAEAIQVTEEEVPVHSIRWFNKTGEEICGLRVNPFAESGQVGLNELGIGESIPPDEYQSLELPEGKVVVEATNCEGQVVADAYQGILIEEPATIHIGISTE